MSTIRELAKDSGFNGKWIVELLDRKGIAKKNIV